MRCKACNKIFEIVEDEDEYCQECITTVSADVTTSLGHNYQHEGAANGVTESQPTDADPDFYM